MLAKQFFQHFHIKLQKQLSKKIVQAKKTKKPQNNKNLHIIRRLEGVRAV